LMGYLSEPSPQALKSLPATYRSSAHRYTQRNGLLFYSAVDDDAPRVVVPLDHDLRLRIMYEYRDAPVSGHRGREKTYLTLSRDFYWPRQYKFVRKYIRACEVCQRVKPAPSLRALLQSLPVSTECWESVSMDFIFGLPEDDNKNNGILVLVDRFSKLVHLVGVPETITAEGCARVFVDTVFRLTGCRVTWSRTEIHGSQRNFGAPCSACSEHGSTCRPLTILSLMVRLSVLIE
jgi:hypothetical protein